MTVHHPQTPQFFLTSPSPCPYLPGHSERKVFTHLVGERAPGLLDLLSQGGFRRSQNIAYRPACERCRACVSVRILVDEFQPGKSMRRILAKNSDLIARMSPASPTSEQYSLFRRYIDHRHAQGIHHGDSDSQLLAQHNGGPAAPDQHGSRREAGRLDHRLRMNPHRVAAAVQPGPL